MLLDQAVARCSLLYRYYRGIMVSWYNGIIMVSYLQSLSHRRNVVRRNLLYRYYRRKCFKELAMLVPPKGVARRDTRFSSDLQSYAVKIPLSK